MVPAALVLVSDPLGMENCTAKMQTTANRFYKP